MSEFRSRGRYFIITLSDGEEIILRSSDTGYVYMCNDNYPNDVWTLIIKYGKHKHKIFFLKRWFYIIKNRIKNFLADLV